MLKKDLVFILLVNYPNRIQPSIPSELQDIADAESCTTEEILQALNIALDMRDLADELHTDAVDLVRSAHANNGPFKLISVDFKNEKLRGIK